MLNNNYYVSSGILTGIPFYVTGLHNFIYMHNVDMFVYNKKDIYWAVLRRSIMPTEMRGVPFTDDVWQQKW